MAIQHFLLVYNLREGTLVDFDEFGTDIGRALAAYADREQTYRARDDHKAFEIVLLGADSRKTLEQTHSRYFDAREAIPF